MFVLFLAVTQNVDGCVERLRDYYYYDPTDFGFSFNTQAQDATKLHLETQKTIGCTGKQHVNNFTKT